MAIQASTDSNLVFHYGKHRAVVASIEDASEKWCAYRDEVDRLTGEGGVSSIGNGGTVKQGGKVVAKISYNGRIWPA